MRDYDNDDHDSETLIKAIKDMLYENNEDEFNEYGYLVDMIDIEFAFVHHKKFVEFKEDIKLLRNMIVDNKGGISITNKIKGLPELYEHILYKIKNGSPFSIEAHKCSFPNNAPQGAGIKKLCWLKKSCPLLFYSTHTKKVK